MSSTGLIKRENFCLFALLTRNGRLLRRTFSNNSEGNEEPSHHDNEVAKFNRLSQQWWDPSSPLMSLLEMNSLRVPLIRDILSNNGLNSMVKKAKPLTGYKILDVGCGGGFLSEPLARLGASVTGIDPAADSIDVAKHHASLDHRILSNVNYKCTTIEKFAEAERGTFDAVVASEVIEHVNDKMSLIQSAKVILKPNGYFFLTTINRTALSLLTAKIVAEFVLHLIPRGAHNWELFITTEELFELLHHSGFEKINFRGMLYNPINRKWSWTKNTSVNYACVCKKSGSEN